MGGTGWCIWLPVKLAQKLYGIVVEGVFSPLTTLTGKWTHKVSRREEPEMPKAKTVLEMTPNSEEPSQQRRAFPFFSQEEEGNQVLAGVLV